MGFTVLPERVGSRTGDAGCGDDSQDSAGVFWAGQIIKAICRELRVSRKAVRKVIRSEATEFHYQRKTQLLPRIGPWQEHLDGLLAGNEGKPRRERQTLIRIFEQLCGLGYEGGYDAVRRYARGWQRQRMSVRDVPRQSRWERATTRMRSATALEAILSQQMVAGKGVC
jgi:hypothetical protein